MISAKTLRILFVPLIVSCLLIASPTPPAEGSATDSQVCAASFVLVGALADYRLRDDVTDTLNQGYYREYDLTLYGGNDYAIAACGCNAVVDLDIILFDRRGNVVDRDTLRDAQPIVTFSPRYTGQYTARVVMYDTHGAGAPHYTMAVLYQ